MLGEKVLKFFVRIGASFRVLKCFVSNFDLGMACDDEVELDKSMDKASSAAVDIMLTSCCVSWETGII